MFIVIRFTVQMLLCIYRKTLKFRIWKKEDFPFFVSRIMFSLVSIEHVRF